MFSILYFFSHITASQQHLVEAVTQSHFYLFFRDYGMLFQALYHDNFYLKSMHELIAFTSYQWAHTFTSSKEKVHRVWIFSYQYKFCIKQKWVKYFPYQTSIFRRNFHIQRQFFFFGFFFEFKFVHSIFQYLNSVSVFLKSFNNFLSYFFVFAFHKMPLIFAFLKPFTLLCIVQ